MDWVKLTYGTVYNVNDIAEYSLRTAIEIFNVYDALRELEIEGKTALDLGCGYGRLTYVLTKFAEYVIGLDVRSEVVELAKKTYRDLHNVDFYVYDGKSIPFPDDYFDIVLTNTVLQHIEDIHVIAKEVNRVCNDWLIVIETNKGITTKGMYPRPISVYSRLFDKFKLIKVKPRMTLINGEIRYSGTIVIYRKYNIT